MTGSAWITRAGLGSRATEEPAAMLIKIGSGLTEGHWALLEGRTAPGIDSGLHRHEDGVKAFYVLDGAYELFCDGSWSDLHAGPEYRAHLARIYVKRALVDAMRGLACEHSRNA